MNIRLNSLKIGNFKGVRNFEVTLDGQDAVITAENGVGKTTIYDAFLWLFFDKDSTGRKAFEVRPLDRHNHPIKGLVVAVEAELDLDGTSHVFRKENHERVVKEQLRGYETLCWIDEVPKKVGEYADYITEHLISEETFKLLTDLHYFNGKLHWEGRRKVLLALAEDIGKPEGFDGLLEALSGRSIKDYEKVLSDQKKRHKTERDEINPRIDEILKGLEHPTDNVAELRVQRLTLEAEIEALNIIRKDLLGHETERQEKKSKAGELFKQKVKREAELESDTSGTKTLTEEKAQIIIDVAKANQLVKAAENGLVVGKAEKTAKDNEIITLLASLDGIRNEYQSFSESPKTSSCYACGQKLPADKLAENEAKLQKRLATITARGNELKAKVDENKKWVAGLDERIKDLEHKRDKGEAELVEMEHRADKRIAEIDEAIKTHPTTPPEQDEAWLKITAEIASVEKEIGPPVAEQLTAIETQRTTKETELNKLNEALAQTDRMTKDRARITELEAKERELAQKIADVEKQLADIEQYKAEQSTMITTAVNGKFKAVEFKMFKELLNGGLEECCEATLKGVPYADMSKGESIYVGIDIINVLSEHFGVSVPVFIDNSESYGMSLEPTSQNIKLNFVKGVKELEVQTKAERMVA